MTDHLKPGSFEGFARWLGKAKYDSDLDATPPDIEVLSAANAAWRDHQSMQRSQRDDLAQRVRAGTYFENIELMAAADSDRDRWLPRLRTPNGFAISALYASNSAPGAPPIGLLVECPADLTEVFRGQKVHVSAGGRWIEIGEIDVDGKVTGDLPEGVEFRPPFAFRVGQLGEHAAELDSSDEPQ
jgi:hypothetical protein